MDNFVGAHNNMLVRWRLLRNNGKPFNVSEYALNIILGTPRGRSEIREFNVTGIDKNIVNFELTAPQLFFLGSASLSMSMRKGGLQVAAVTELNAFKVGRELQHHCDCAQVVELTSFVNVLHPEEDTGNLKVLFPSFSVNDDMHLILHGEVGEAYDSNFDLNEHGHLIFDNDN